MNELNNLKKIVKKLNKDEFNTLISIIKKDEELKSNADLLEEEFALRKMFLRTISNEGTDNYELLRKIYAEEIYKLSSLINNIDILNRISGAKILIYGETGTGKTSLVEVIRDNNPKIKFEKLNLENLVSPKLGQTQINILTYVNNLNSNYKDEKIILFIDELDSFIHNRTFAKSDVTEHSRIIATFLKFLDMLQPNIILIAATNIIELIDEAVLRRFNVKVEGKNIKFENIIEEANKTFLYEEDVIKLHTVNKIKPFIINDSFKLSTLSEYKNQYIIEKSINNIVDPLKLFFNLNKNHFTDNFETLSKRLVKKLGVDDE